jgi:hypothetical protein
MITNSDLICGRIFRPEKSPMLPLLGQRRWGSEGVSNLKVPMVLTEPLNLPPSSNVSSLSFSSGSFSYSRLVILPDLPLLPEVETKPYGRLRGHALDIEGVKSC